VELGAGASAAGEVEKEGVTSSTSVAMPRSVQEAEREGTGRTMPGRERETTPSFTRRASPAIARTSWRGAPPAPRRPRRSSPSPLP